MHEELLAKDPEDSHVRSHPTSSRGPCKLNMELACSSGTVTPIVLETAENFHRPGPWAEHVGGRVGAFSWPKGQHAVCSRGQLDGR